MTETLELLEGRKELLETEIKKLQEIKKNLEQDITQFNFTDISESIENTLSEKLWWAEQVENDLLCEVTLRGC